MDKINTSQTYRIRILSPVHIGSGRKYLKGIDFIDDRRKRRTGIVYHPEIHNLIANDKQAINRLSEIDGRDYKIDDFLREFRIESRLKSIRYYPFTVYSREILEIQRNGLGVPQIPGSSIKGSIRSALFHTLFLSLEKQEQKRLLETIHQRTRDKFAASDIEKEIFGKEPNTDFLKAVIVTDADFNSGDIDLGIAQVLSATRDSGWRWKPNKFNDFPMSLSFEYLKGNSSSETTIRLNQYFINDTIARDYLKFNQKLPQDMIALNSVINNCSRDLVQKELEFLYRYDPNHDLRSIAGFYENLARQFPDDNQGCVLRIGWGSGWTSMTGNILDDFGDYLYNFREWFGMGRRDFDFPKSRKLIMRGRNPVAVPGWIRLEII